MDYYIGIMTGNSMDAIDVVYAAVSDNDIHPIHTLSLPFTTDMQQRINELRSLAQKCDNREQLENNPLFQTIHTAYIKQVSAAVVQLIQQKNIDVASIRAICSHGKTLDHLPPSSGTPSPYTLQIGSGKMLADEIDRMLSAENISHSAIRVLYDFRSDDIMNGGDGAPLIPPLNALIAQQDKQPDRIDINAGNTANLCVIKNGQAIAGWDIGPCNEYMDYLVRRHTDLPFDKDGKIARQGTLNPALLKELFEINASFYTMKPPKSGDPAYYHTNEISIFKQKEKLADNLYTCAYFAAYLTVFSLQFINNTMPCYFSLFGGGWKHPVLLESLQKLLNRNGYLLPEHTAIFEKIYQRFSQPVSVTIHPYGPWMESLLWARMGYCFDQKIAWTTPHLTGCRTPTICGMEAISDPKRTEYEDCICRAYKGWQQKK